MYYVTFIVLVLLARKPVEKFILAKKWQGGFAMVARFWVIYFTITLNDIGWYMWS